MQQLISSYSYNRPVLDNFGHYSDFGAMEWVGWKGLRVSKYVQIFITFLDAIASPSTYPCQSVSGSVIDSFRLEIAIASPSFASLFFHTRHHLVDILYKYFSIFEKRRKEALVAVVISSHYPP